MVWEKVNEAILEFPQNCKGVRHRPNEARWNKTREKVVGNDEGYAKDGKEV